MTPSPVRKPKPPSTFAADRNPIIFRLLFVLPFAAALGLVAWSLHRLQPVLKETSAIAARVNRISSQVEAMETTCQRTIRDAVPERFKDSLGSYVEGENSLRDWLADLREKAIPLALIVTSEIGEPVVHTVGGQALSLIPVKLEIQPNEDVNPARSAYQRLIEFCQFIAAHPRRADVSELSVGGSTGSVSRAVLALNIWARPPEA